MQRRSGFTLVEVSIVLLLLALLAGGIMVGRTMIRSSEIRSVIKDHDELSSAIRLFKDRYGSLPGDMPDATRYWGALDADATLCKAIKGNSTKTCNGDGNGIINGNSNERFRMWQHLSNAELVSGRYTGVNADGASDYHIPGENTPRTKLGAGWSVNYSAAVIATSTMWGNISGYYTRLCLPVKDSDLSAPMLSPDEMWNLDMKADDGLPGSGTMRSATWQTCSAAAARGDFATAEYNLTSERTSCCPVFMDVVP